MKIFPLLVLITISSASQESHLVKGIKKTIRHFYEFSKETEKHLQEWNSRSGAAICISSEPKQVSSTKRTEEMSLQFQENLEFLAAICTLTKEKSIISRKIHRKIRQDKDRGRQLLKKYEEIYGEDERSAKYTLKEQECKEPGSLELSKVAIQVYKNFQKLLKPLL